MFHAGDDWHVTQARRVVLGTPSAYPDVAGNLWPSDHAAVLTSFEYSPPGDSVFVDGFESM